MQTGQNQIVTRVRIEFGARVLLPLAGVKLAHSGFERVELLEGGSGKSNSDLAIK